MTDVTPADVAAAAQLACLLEASASKPGNVTPNRPFIDAQYIDFLASAAAIGEPLAGAGARPVGVTVRLAVESTSRWAHSNTNLGIILLLSPLARAAMVDKSIVDLFRRGPPTGTPTPRFLETFRGATRRVLDALTIEDARDAYAAIRQAAPGGLGRVDAQDVSSEPDVTLLDAMRLAADRDGIAREYATAFQATFETGAPALALALRDGLAWDAAVIETFLTLLSTFPDTHVIRRGGQALASEVRRLAVAALGAGGVRSAAGRQAIDDMDSAIREPRHLANPGTTADLTAASIFVVLLSGGWRTS